MKKAAMGLLIMSVITLSACSSTMPSQPVSEAVPLQPPVTAAQKTNPQLSRSNELSTSFPSNQSNTSSSPVAIAAEINKPVVPVNAIQVSMGPEDKSKLSHALDKSLGKKTEWTNELTKTIYTVVPVRKITINENHFCRKYMLSATKNDETREAHGTACVTEDGEWHEVVE